MRAVFQPPSGSCQERVDVEALGAAHLVGGHDGVAREREDLRSVARPGLVTADHEGIEMTSLGWFFVRGLVMAFDPHLRTADRRCFSLVI
jgi:oxygen-independent coproporphyrinogen-3 oxidase